jgi:hypothetical protein
MLITDRLRAQYILSANKSAQISQLKKLNIQIPMLVPFNTHVEIILLDFIAVAASRQRSELSF